MHWAASIHRDNLLPSSSGKCRLPNFSLLNYCLHHFEAPRAPSAMLSPRTGPPAADQTLCSCQWKAYCRKWEKHQKTSWFCLTLDFKVAKGEGIKKRTERTASPYGAAEKTRAQSNPSCFSFSLTCQQRNTNGNTALCSSLSHQGWKHDHPNSHSRQQQLPAGGTCPKNTTQAQPHQCAVLSAASAPQGREVPNKWKKWGLSDSPSSHGSFCLLISHPAGPTCRGHPVNAILNNSNAGSCQPRRAVVPRGMRQEGQSKPELKVR